MITMKNKMCCPGCGATESKPIGNERKEKLYWMGANKGTTDFVILMSNFENTFVGFKSPEYPVQNLDRFDYYCTDCFIRLSKEQGYPCKEDWQGDVSDDVDEE